MVTAIAESPIDTALCSDCPWCHPELVGEKVLALFAAITKLRAITLPGLKVSRAGSLSRNPGGLWLADNGAFGESVFYGSVRSDGSTRLSDAFRALSREDQLIIAGRLRRLAAFGLAELVRTGRENGFCCFCGEELTDPVSIALGYGPTCAKNTGLPHDAATAGVTRVKAKASVKRAKCAGGLRERLGVAEVDHEAELRTREALAEQNGDAFEAFYNERS